MLIVRREQFESLEAAAHVEFERELVAHFQDFVPHHSNALGEEGLLKVVKLGIERAKSFDFTFRGPIRFFIDLMFKCGSGFATDPQLKWAREALADRAGDQMARSERLYDAYMKYDEKVVGPDSEFARKAGSKAAKLKSSELDVPEGQDRLSVMLAKMKECYPEKAAVVGDSVLASLLPLGTQRAAKYGVTSPRGGLLFAVLMFACGHQFDTDPVFPWIEATLTNDRDDDPERRAERVATKTLTFAARAMANMERS
ncbi:MAG: hypothetical protein U0798_16035 [Gemmataceae bacterium]